MLAFRSEAHVERWCRERGLEPGAVFPLERCRQLASAWYADRLSPQWRRRTPDEAQALLDELGLRGPFWQLTRPG